MTWHLATLTMMWGALMRCDYETLKKAKSWRKLYLAQHFLGAPKNWILYDHCYGASVKNLTLNSLFLLCLCVCWKAEKEENWLIHHRQKFTGTARFQIFSFLPQEEEEGKNLDSLTKLIVEQATLLITHTHSDTINASQSKLPQTGML